MATYPEILLQIETLKSEAEKARRSEFVSVVKSIKAQIKSYNITAQDLGLDMPPKSRTSRKKGASKVKGLKTGIRSRRSSVKVEAKYRDGRGNSWTGRGKTPLWLRDALASGSTLDMFLVRDGSV